MLPYPWRVSIGAARAALGLGCFALHLTFFPRLFSWTALPLAGFIVYAILALRHSMQRGGRPLLTLTVDTACFLIWLVLASSYGYGGIFWTMLALSIYVFLIVSAVINQEWSRVAMVILLSLATVVAVPNAELSSLAPTMIWCALLTEAWILDRSFLRKRLVRASRHSVLYRFEAQQAREEERQRIGDDFHDGPLQSFIGFQMRLETIKRLLARDPKIAEAEVRDLQALCQSQVGELRAFVRSMRPVEVEGSTLGASISDMVARFQKDTGILASFTGAGDLDPAEGGTSLELLQIVREALNNVRKHSGATRVEVALRRTGETMEVSVNDNGEGFPFSGTYSLDQLESLRMGPLSIRRRVRALGGQLKVDSRPGEGAGLVVRVALS